MTPEELLLKAVKERHYNGVKRAFEAKANVNATDDAGWTSLHRAAYHGFDEIGDFLLGHSDIDPAWTPPVFWAFIPVAPKKAAAFCRIGTFSIAETEGFLVCTASTSSAPRVDIYKRDVFLIPAISATPRSAYLPVSEAFQVGP